MTVTTIRSDAGLRVAFLQLESFFQAAESTAEGDEREVLVTLIEAYENKHYPIDAPDPIEAIKFRIEQQSQ